METMEWILTAVIALVCGGLIGVKMGAREPIFGKEKARASGQRAEPEVKRTPKAARPMRVLKNKIHCHLPHPKDRDPDVLPAATAAVAAVELDF